MSMSFLYNFKDRKQDPIKWYQSNSMGATEKRMEAVEEGLGLLQDQMQVIGTQIQKQGTDLIYVKHKMDELSSTMNKLLELSAHSKSMGRGGMETTNSEILTRSSMAGFSFSTNSSTTASSSSSTSPLSIASNPSSSPSLFGAPATSNPTFGAPSSVVASTPSFGFSLSSSSSYTPSSAAPPPSFGFGATAAATTGATLFGTSTPAASSPFGGSGLFESGSSSSGTTATTTSLLGSCSTFGTGNVFGASSAPASNSSTGTTINSPSCSSGLFGSSSSSSGTSTLNFSSTTFGASPSIASSSATTYPSITTLFGSTSSAATTAPSIPGLFGSSSSASSITSTVTTTPNSSSIPIDNVSVVRSVQASVQHVISDPVSSLDSKVPNLEEVKWQQNSAHFAAVLGPVLAQMAHGNTANSWVEMAASAANLIGSDQKVLEESFGHNLPTDSVGAGLQLQQNVTQIAASLDENIDMPTFDGSDPDGWTMLAERYFAVYQLINEEKVEAAVLSLSGGKVMEILSHVNKRVKHQQEIGLPWEELWQLYMEDNTASMVRNFCIVYVEMAFDRVSKEKKENFAPTMIANISKLPTQHQDIILGIVIKVIGECHSRHEAVIKNKGELLKKTTSGVELDGPKLIIRLFLPFNGNVGAEHKDQGRSATNCRTYVAAIRFLLQCFEADVEKNIELLSSLGNMCWSLEHAMAYEGSIELHDAASKALIKIGSHFSEVLASRYVVKLAWLKQLLAHVDSDTRECAARLLEIASCGFSIYAASDHELTSSSNGSAKSRFEVQHGMICALGYVTANIHSVFHVSQLRSAYGVPGQTADLPTQLSEELERQVVPGTLLGTRKRSENGAEVWEVVIEWQGLSKEEATWEDYDQTNMQFPEFHLEDKVKVWVAGIDKPQPWTLYQRKKTTTAHGGN